MDQGLWDVSKLVNVCVNCYATSVLLLALNSQVNKVHSVALLRQEDKQLNSSAAVVH